MIEPLQLIRTELYHYRERNSDTLTGHTLARGAELAGLGAVASSFLFESMTLGKIGLAGVVGGICIDAVSGRLAERQHELTGIGELTVSDDGKTH